MVTHQLAKPTLFGDINNTEAIGSTSAEIVEAYHHTAERIVAFNDRLQERLTAAESGLGLLAAKTSLWLPRQRVVEGFRRATQVGLFHLYNQRLGTFYGGLLERAAPEYFSGVPEPTSIDELQDKEREEYKALRDYDARFPRDEPIFDLEVEALRTAHAVRVMEAIPQDSFQPGVTIGRLNAFRPGSIYYDLVYDFYQDEAPRHGLVPNQFEPQAFRS